jgi:hypothetical protein
MSYTPVVQSVVCGINGCTTAVVQDFWSFDLLRHILIDHVGLPSFLLSAPSVTCNINTCGATIPVERDHRALSVHLEIYHGYVPGDGQGDGTTICRWIVSEQPSQSLGVPCTWQGQSSSVLDHVVTSHLGFVDLCSACGEGPFSGKFAQKRHKTTCKGRIPGRCRKCLRRFSSRSALGGHVELNLCWPPP